MLNTLFIWINFFVIVGLVLYALYKYGLPVFKKNIATQKALYDDARDASRKSLEEKNNLLNTIDAQKLLFDTLLQRMESWKRENKHYQDKCFAEQQLIIMELEKKYKIQAEQEALRHAYQEITPSVFNQLNSDLKKNFSQQAERRRYSSSVIEMLKKV